MDTSEVRGSYDLVAQAYHQRFGNELDSKAFDREWLSTFGKLLAPTARALEVGCGDGHVADYLFRLGIATEGLDLSPEMVVVSEAAYPHLRFTCGDMLSLPFENSSFDAVVSFYSIVNLDGDDCRIAFAEIGRILKTGGLFTLAFHVGEERLRVEDWLETQAQLDFYFHPVERVSQQLREASLKALDIKTRAPYSEDVEAQTTRAYVLAQKV